MLSRASPTEELYTRTHVRRRGRRVESATTTVRGTLDVRYALRCVVCTPVCTQITVDVRKGSVYAVYTSAAMRATFICHFVYTTPHDRHETRDTRSPKARLSVRTTPRRLFVESGLLVY